MTETEADDMFDKGKISAVARKAVSNINGHSDTTVKNYYVKKKRRQDAEDSREMFDVIGRENPLSSDNWFAKDDNYNDTQWNESVIESNDVFSFDNSQRETTPKSHFHVQLSPPSSLSPSSKLLLQSPGKSPLRSDVRWGHHHPEFNLPKTRISWSDEENEYIRSWWRENCSTCSTNVAAKLLAHIRNDKDAHAIFHSNHTLDSSRIRHGLRKNGINK